jgi:hypothetical protein
VCGWRREILGGSPQGTQLAIANQPEHLDEQLLLGAEVSVVPAATPAPSVTAIADAAP